jgi:hypothetical protein
MGEQSQYASDQDRAAVAKVVERIFSWAIACDVDVLVMPPLGCGTNGCQHPHLDMADLIHDAAVRHERHLNRLVIASDHEYHLTGGWWEGYIDAVRNGRLPIERPVRVPVPAFPRPIKDKAALAEKARKLVGLPKPRGPRHTFL